MTDDPFDAISPADGFVASRVTFYAALYPRLRQVAREHGYALAIHGSLTKDLDVLAVPWTLEAATEDRLVVALTEAAGGFVVKDDPVDMPHGRRAWTIHLGTTGGYVDLSVMPRRPEPQRWCIVSDDSSHRYLCPSDRADEVEEQFQALADYWSGDNDGVLCPADPSVELERVEGGRLTFTDPRREP